MNWDIVAPARHASSRPAGSRPGDDLADFDHQGCRADRNDLRYAPWSYVGAMFATLVLLPIPLYLLKMEATPQEIAWLPCLVFVTFVLPAIVILHLVVLWTSQYTSWDGVDAWVRQHAMLVPVPFVGISHVDLDNRVSAVMISDDKTCADDSERVSLRVVLNRPH